MTEEERKLAAYLYNTLNGGDVTIPARESEIMSMAKVWLKTCANKRIRKRTKKDEPLKVVKKDDNASASREVL